MAYQRFLTNNDYLALVTEEGLGQLVRGNEQRLAQAEQRAESKIVDYLDQFYAIGAELDKGKRIKDYCNLVTYPSGVFFKYEGKIWRTCKSMNALHKPTPVQYWEPQEDLVLPAEQKPEAANKVLPYLQQKTYKPGDVVTYLGSSWRCLVANGWDFKNIQIPGIVYWKEVQAPAWVANYHYTVGDVVAYDGDFYAVLVDDNTYASEDDAGNTTGGSDTDEDTTEDTSDDASEEEGESDDESTSSETVTPTESSASPLVWSDNPSINDAFGLIGTYDAGYDYTVDENDYVVLDGKVYVPALSPNAEEPEENVNIVQDDPRNYNLVNYMTAISLYYLNALIAPTNISQARIVMFEEAISWAESAAKMKIDPHIPRKVDKKTSEPMDDWAMASFETNAATQINSPWFT